MELGPQGLRCRARRRDDRLPQPDADDEHVGETTYPLLDRLDPVDGVGRLHIGAENSSGSPQDRKRRDASERWPMSHRPGPGHRPRSRSRLAAPAPAAWPTAHAAPRSGPARRNVVLARQRSHDEQDQVRRRRPLRPAARRAWRTVGASAGVRPGAAGVVKEPTSKPAATRSAGIGRCLGTARPSAPAGRPSSSPGGRAPPIPRPRRTSDTYRGLRPVRPVSSTRSMCTTRSTAPAASRYGERVGHPDTGRQAQRHKASRRHDAPNGRAACTATRPRAHRL